MIRSLTGAALVAPVVFGACFWLGAARPTPATPCQNILPHEPVLIMTRSLAGPGGTAFNQLTVHSSGGATLLIETNPPGPRDPGLLLVERAVFDPLVAQSLVNDLEVAGAFTLCDQGLLPVADVPLTTLTVLRGSTDAKAHTFSFQGGACYGEAADVLNGFIEKYFPGI